MPPKNTEEDLDEEEEYKDSSEGGVDVRCEFAAAVGVAEEVAEDGEEGAEGLGRDVPPGTDDLGGVSSCHLGKREPLRGVWKISVHLEPCRGRRGGRRRFG
ncbi:MAG: hypothetical protein Q9166_007588 [cf. Caloplaca sp. 2 TL-2023]